MLFLCINLQGVSSTQIPMGAPVIINNYSNTKDYLRSSNRLFSLLSYVFCLCKKLTWGLFHSNALGGSRLKNMELSSAGNSGSSNRVSSAAHCSLISSKCCFLIPEIKSLSSFLECLPPIAFR